MANPQLENGYFRIANEIAEALTRTNLSAYQSRILWAILRKTYGFSKKEDWIAISQLVSLTGLRKQHVSRTLKELRDRNMVTKRGYQIAFNKDYQGWRELPKGVTSHKSNLRGLKSNLKGDTQKTLNKRNKLSDFPNPASKPDFGKPTTKDFLLFFANLFQEQTGKAYMIDWGKDGKLAKAMLKIHPLPYLQELARRFFQSKDEFIQKSGHSIGTFKTRINKLAEGEKCQTQSGFKKNF